VALENQQLFVFYSGFMTLHLVKF